MFKACGEIFTYLLAAYGTFCIIISIWHSISQRMHYKNNDVKLVLIVKNQEETIEGIVRSAFSEDNLRKIMSTEKPAIVDMGSTDNTIDIISKLNKNFEYFEIFNKSSREEIFSSFEDNSD